jgi:type III pantothenate kinase
MLLVLDVGNTNVTIGVYEGQRLLFVSRVATELAKMEDQYAIDLCDIFDLYKVDSRAFSGAVLSSVVPSLDRALCHAVEKVTGVRPMQVRPGIKTGLNVRIDNPNQLGADLLVGAVAAVELYGAPCVVWDLGTATTVSVVDKEGAFRGGAIMAGVYTALDSLTARASLLPRIGLDTPACCIGRNTVECMQSGTVFGTAAMMDGMCARIEEELGYPARVIVTGGLGREVSSVCRCEMTYAPDLLLEGLRILYEKNKK